MAARKPKARGDIEVVELDGEAVVVDPARGENGVHYLNRSAALVYALCDGTATVREIAEAIADVYQLPHDEIHGQVRQLVRDLHGMELLEPRQATNGKLGDERRRIRIEVPRSS